VDDSQTVIFITLACLAVICAVVLATRKGKKQKRLTPLAGVALAFVVAGIVFGQDRLLGYGLMAVGVLLAVADMLKKPKK
jgi:uncharacterized membrane protein